MGALQALTTRGAGLKAAVLKQAVMGDFTARLRGKVLEPGDATYDDARKIWKGMIDKRPAPKSPAMKPPPTDQFSQIRSRA